MSHNILMKDSLVQFSGSEENPKINYAEQIVVPLDYNVLKGYELKVRCSTYEKEFAEFSVCIS